MTNARPMAPAAPPTALRVGLLGEPGTTLAPTLDRLAAAVPPGTGPPLLSLLCAGPAPSLACPPWAIHHLGTPPDAADTLVRNCDVLLTVGDARDEPLASAARLAARLEIPVLWLQPGQPPRLLLHADWQLMHEPPPDGPAALAALDASIRTLLQHPPPSPAASTLVDRAPLPGRWVWRSHRWVMERLWRPHAPAELPEAPTPYWAPLFDTADRLATAYADRYRSSYTLVVALAAIALVAAVLGLGLPHDAHDEPILHPYWTALPEAACLGAIIALVWINRRSAWQSRLIACRLLAELCRKQAALALLGRSLPASRIARITKSRIARITKSRIARMTKGRTPQTTQPNDLAWAGERFAAAVRASPPPPGPLAGPALATARDQAAAILLHGQRAYHAARAEAGRGREDRLVALGAGAFALTVLFVAIKLALLARHSEHAELFGLFAAILPAFAAAVFGVRAYAELDLMVEHSERMLGVLDAAEDRLACIDPDRPGAHRPIGDVFEDTAAAMLADVEGWMEISRVKAVEAG